MQPLNKRNGVNVNIQSVDTQRNKKIGLTRQNCFSNNLATGPPPNRLDMFAFLCAHACLLYLSGLCLLVRRNCSGLLALKVSLTAMSLCVILKPSSSSFIAENHFIVSVLVLLRFSQSLLVCLVVFFTVLFF